jgi:multiple sugar transport system ATP-binding protein
MAQVKYVSASRVYAKDTPPAVDALDLDIKDGEFMVLVGPSGSGKTTALRMLAGLEPLDGGHVEIGEKDVTWVPPKDRDIAMVFQNYALYPNKTVAENMGFGRAGDPSPSSSRTPWPTSRWPTPDPRSSGWPCAKPHSSYTQATR